MANEKKFHVGVKGMVEDETGRILLMREDVRKHSMPTTEYWDFPGGRMNEDETVLQTLYREIEEETGITEVKDPKFLTAVISNHEIKLKNSEIVGLVLMVYEVRVNPEAKIQLSHEHLGYEWVSRAEAKKRLAHKYPKEFTDRL